MNHVPGTVVELFQFALGRGCPAVRGRSHPKSLLCGIVLNLGKMERQDGLVDSVGIRQLEQLNTCPQAGQHLAQVVLVAIQLGEHDRRR
jgi:hypothetical protein